MLQPQQQARAWNVGQLETNMDAVNAQQWPTDLPPHFVLHTKPRAVPRHFHPQLHPPLFETQSIMGSPDWNGVFKFEGDIAFSDGNPFGSSAVSGVFPSSSQQSPWSVAPPHLPLQQSQQPFPAPVPSNGQASAMSDRWPPRQTSITSQSSRASHPSSITTQVRSNAWSLPLTDGATINALQPSSNATSEPEQTNLTQYSTTAMPSMLSSSYSSTGGMSFGPQANNAVSYNSASSDSPIVAPRNLHDGSWDMFNPMNQYPGITTQSFVPSQPAFATNLSGLPLQAAASTHAPQASNFAQNQNPFLDDSYSVSPTWSEWQKCVNNSFSSESEMASPISPNLRTDAQASFRNQSFCSSVDSYAMPMPALTYSQTSPASDFEDVSSGCPGEHHAHADHGRHERHRQRNLRPLVEGNNRFATLPSQTKGPVEWNPRPHAPKDDGYARIEGRRKDHLLVQWKKAGMSYRQIRDKGGFTEAESTLRGRYRTLTKNREERVRKPLWMAKDDVQVHLLREGVKMLMAGSLYPGMDAAAIDVDEMDIDASKVPWKKVAEYIFEHGGSYHFGNATCKKQWLKIQGMQ